MKLSISNLSKTYSNGVKAINDLNLEIGKGMFALLGPNGAGKSSLMRTIATLQQPDSGTIHFNGIDVLKDQLELRKTLGYLPQEFGVYPKISAEGLLDYFATVKGIGSRKNRAMIIQHVLELTNLYDVRKKYVHGYSGGMKQRFGIAQMLLNNPNLIIVDEPTAGLDPAERSRFLNILREIAAENIVIFSTHIVDDVKELCTDMAIVNTGRVLYHETPANALKQIEDKVWGKTINREELDAAELKYNLLSSNFNQDNTVNIRVYAEERPHSDFTNTTAQLDDVYFITLKANQLTHTSI